MPRYTGVSCPYCSEKFTDQDDIVVCPDCGAPHHRACWNAEHKCHFEVLHGEGFEWKMPFEETEKKDENEKTTVICQSCGKENPAEASVCENCGAPLGMQNAGGMMLPFMDPLGGVPKDEIIDGVRAEELGSFIGERSPYFVSLFNFFVKRGSTVSFNFFAFIFNGYWFLSKKMYALGAAICAVTLSIFGARTLIEYHILETYGTNFIPADIKSKKDLFALGIYGMLLIVHFVIMLLCGLFANSIYMKHCTKTIKSISDSQSKSEVFAKKGGTNMLIAASVYSCYMILSAFGYNIAEYILNLIK